MEHQPPEKAGDYNQALMELGALICVPNGAPFAGSARWQKSALPGRRAPPPNCPKRQSPSPANCAGNAGACGKPGGLSGAAAAAKRLLAGLWQPVLWEGEHLLQAEVLARLTALGLDTGAAQPAALPAAKHIFTHIEWLMSGVQLRVPAQSAPAGYVWASREALRTTTPARGVPGV